MTDEEMSRGIVALLKLLYPEGITADGVAELSPRMLAYAESVKEDSPQAREVLLAGLDSLEALFDALHGRQHVH